MNKNQTRDANHYLAKFADLTRKVLDSSEQELISLEDELKILDDYLQMEQLRFGFEYRISVDEKINIANTEVPAMLLQPFVENGVKHGIATLHEKGLIEVVIDKDGNDLLLKVVDNGKGFGEMNGKEKGSSLGIKLSEERIVLLNKVYKEHPSSLAIQSSDSGTSVSMRLANWVS
jgi:LytS/YehU family sensor histidine kinase